jgi:thiol:disulfide interchange protein DsbD
MGVVAYHFLAAKEIAGSADTRVRPDAVVQIRQARQQNLPTLLEFWAPWCAICRQIQREVFGKPAVQDRLRSVVVVKINYDTNADLVREFGVIGPPAFIFLDATGRQVGTVAVTARELEERILRGW